MPTRTIKKIELENGTTIYVEVEEVDVPKILPHPSGLDLPEGAELTSTTEQMVNAAKTLREMLRGVFDTVHEALREKSPDEWGIELNVAFKGKLYVVPVIVSGESEASLKVHAKWVKPKQPSGDLANG